MVSHALTQQAGIQFVAHIALDKLAVYLRAVIAGELDDRTHQRDDDDADTHTRHLLKIVILSHRVEGIADKLRNQSRPGSIAERAHNHQHADPPVAEHMGQNESYGIGMIACKGTSSVEFNGHKRSRSLSASPMVAYHAQPK